MHRRFRFCGRFALLRAFAAAPLLAFAAIAEEPAASPEKEHNTANPPPAIPLPTPGKHQLKVTPLQMVQHQAEVLAAKLETQGSLLVSLTQQIEEQKKEIEALKEKNESLATNLTMLEGQVSNLNDTLEEMNTPPGTASKAAAPSAIATAPKRAKSARAIDPSEFRLPDQAGETGDLADDIPPASSLTHIVARGENLTTIARKYGTTAGDLLKLNKIRDERKLQIGQQLMIPADATAAATSAANTPGPGSSTP